MAIPTETLLATLTSDLMERAERIARILEPELTQTKYGSELGGASVLSSLAAEWSCDLDVSGDVQVDRTTELVIRREIERT